MVCRFFLPGHCGLTKGVGHGDQTGLAGRHGGRFGGMAGRGLAGGAQGTPMNMDIDNLRVQAPVAPKQSPNAKEPRWPMPASFRGEHEPTRLPIGRESVLDGAGRRRYHVACPRSKDNSLDCEPRLATGGARPFSQGYEPGSRALDREANRASFRDGTADNLSAARTKWPLITIVLLLSRPNSATPKTLANHCLSWAYLGRDYDR